MSQAVPPPGTPQYNDPRGAKAQAAADKAYKKASRPWFKKKRFILPLLLILLIILINVFSGGGDDSDNANTSTPATSSSAEAAPTEEGAAPSEESAPAEEAPAEEATPAFPGAQDSDVIGQAGEDLTLGDITVNSSALIEGDATFNPTLCTTVSVANGSDETADFNLFDWKLQSPGGTILTTSIAGSENILNSGQLAPGGSTTGDVCFDGDPAEAGQFVVLYEPAFAFFSDRGAWVSTR